MMSLTITNYKDPDHGKIPRKGKVKATPKPEPILTTRAGIPMEIEQIEVFGRLKIPIVLMAQYYGITRSTMTTHMKRVDLKAAYDRGRAETVIALRQKQLTNALAGDNRMLIFAGEQFADQTPEDRERAGDPTSDVSGRTWDGWVKDQALALRNKIMDDAE